MQAPCTTFQRCHAAPVHRLPDSVVPPRGAAGAWEAGRLRRPPVRPRASLKLLAAARVFGVLVAAGLAALAHAADPPDARQPFRPAAPGHAYAFPRDHGSHPAYRTEWWYHTGHLFDAAGRHRFGYELTFFRRGIQREDSDRARSRWAIDDLYLAHFALTDIDGERFLYDEKISRAGVGKAGAVTGTLRVWIDRWSAELVSSDPAVIQLRASGDGAALDLRLTARKPPVVHGLDGISRKGQPAGRASHYYSLTRLATEGTVRLGAERVAVSGVSWMDHEFGSGGLGEQVVGWDWFSVQLDDRTELMFYLLRRRDGVPDAASSGTFVQADGRVRHLTAREVGITVLAHWVSRASGARYPSRWRIVVPDLALSLQLSPFLSNQELITNRSTRVTYWEGAVTVDGTRDDTPVAGQGYVELTGYAVPFDQRP